MKFKRPNLSAFHVAMPKLLLWYHIGMGAIKAAQPPNIHSLSHATFAAEIP